MITFYNALDGWGREAKKSMPNLDKMRLWIKYASQVRESDKEAVEKFTDMVEGEVFGYAPSV